MIINNIGINFAGGGGGGSSAVLESKDYSITQNGTTSIHPSEGVDGISGGTITVAVPDPVLESKNYTINTNGDTTITPSQGVNGISGGTISVNVTPSLTADTFTENGTYTPGEGIDGFSSVTVNVGGVQENRLNLALKKTITAVTMSDTSGVTTIPQYAFQSLYSLVSVNLDSSVTNVDMYAFQYDRELKQINLDNVQNIRRQAFQNCSGLTSVTLTNCTYLGEECFGGCKALTGHLDLYVDDIHERRIFSDCTGLTSITFNKNIPQLGYNNTSASYGAFQNCTSMEYIDLTHNYKVPTMKPQNMFTAFTANYEIRVPNTLVDAFKTAEGWSAGTIPDHIVGYPDIYNSPSISFTATTDVTPNLAYDNTGWTAGFVSSSSTSGVTFYGEPTIPASAFNGKTALTRVVIDEGFDMSRTGYYQFHNCSNLESVTLPNSITFIPMYTFSGCTSLIDCNIPSGITSIGTGAFARTQMPNVVIPSSVTELQNISFSGAGVQNVTINAVGSIGMSAFQDCKSLNTVVIGSGITAISQDAFRGCTGLTSVTLTDSVTEIGTNAFANCGLVEFDFPSGITQIKVGTFNNNPIRRVMIPATGVTVATNNGGAWSGCSQIVECSIPAVSQSFGPNNYFGDSKASITACTLPEGIELLDNYAFNGCTAIPAITLPSTLTGLSRSSTFADCTSLTSLTFKASTPPTMSGYGTSIFNNVPSNGTLYCPAESVADYTTWKSGFAQLADWTVQAIS